MSVNRSVQAAQRRRAGPSNNEPPVPGRKPQPSINSAQMFANQSKSGPGPNIPTGRLAGQQEAIQQQQMHQQIHQQNNDKLSSVSKLTVAQAITLITLRLGSIETKIMHMPEGLMNMDEKTSVDVVQSIHSRLESLEKRSDSGISDLSSAPELKLFKQQMETIKQAVVQNKNLLANLVKENNMLKTQVENLKKELSETKELSQSLEKMTFENSQSILKLSMNSDNGEDNVLNNMVLDELKNNELYDCELYDGQFEELQNDQLHNDGLQDDENQNNELQDGTIVATNLKQLIESELRV